MKQQPVVIGPEFKKLAKIEKALTIFDITEKVLSELEESTKLVITDTESEKVIRKFRQQTKSLQVNVEKKRKSLNSTFKKTTDENAKLLKNRLDPVYDDLDEKIKVVEKVAADKKAEKDRVEAERVEKIDLHMLALDELISEGGGYNIPSEPLKIALENLNLFKISSVDFQEKTREAEQRLATGIVNTGNALAARIIHEDEQAKLAKQKKEQAAEAKRLADEKAAFGAVQRATRKTEEAERNAEKKRAAKIQADLDKREEALEKEKFEIATQKQAEEDKKALDIQLEKDFVAALAEDKKFEAAKKAQLKKDKARAKSIRSDKKQLAKYSNETDRLVSCVSNLEVCDIITSDATTLLFEHIENIKLEIKRFDDAIEDLV